MKIIKKVIVVFLLLLLFVSLNYAQRLPQAAPEDVGMSSTHFDLVNELITQAIEQKDFPGAVLLVGKNGKIVLRKAYGESQWIPERQPMKAAMIFDLASITKPVATATSIMILIEQGKIRLWDKVMNFIPEFKPYEDDEGKATGDALIWHLLTHTSGLPPYADAGEIEEKHGFPCPLDVLVKHIALMKKSDPPGKAFHYSCLGYISLAYIIKKISGLSVDEFAEKHIFLPLGMKQTFFAPSQEYHNLCVPTEVIDGVPLRGVVHDPLARLQAGISGNAGLFSTADDLAVFAQMMLYKGKFEGIRILSPLSVERMASVFPYVPFSGRGLGWDLDSSYSTSGGDLFGPNSYGHTGYTGTSIWIDPDTETFIIFLTNRVHPDDKGKIGATRSKVANIVASSIR